MSSMAVKTGSNISLQLFYAVILHKNLTFGNADHDALSKMMGEGKNPTRITSMSLVVCSATYMSLLDAAFSETFMLVYNNSCLSSSCHLTANHG
jgi:hypothetical protein